MSLRLKLILTYVIMLIITVGIVVISGVGIITYAMGQTVKSYIGDQSGESAVSRVIDVVVDLRYNQKYHPEALLEDDFSTQIAEQIKVFDGFLVVKSNRQYKAFGIANADENLYRKLEESQDEMNSEEHGINANGLSLKNSKILWENVNYFVLKYEFNEQDTLNYFFVFKIKQPGNLGGSHNKVLLAGLILLAAVVIGPLLWIITKDIVVPLKKLDNCAQEIARGNLDFHLYSKSNNEIGSVIRSYEKMRFELKKSITSQLEMEENRKQLLSNITHDLKTPITSIKGYIQGIRDGVANDPEKVSKYLDVIYTKTVDMNAMIDDLFLFSKLDLRKEPFNKDYIDVSEFYHNSMQELHLELDGKGVELVTECHIPEGFKVLMDSQKIKRVILNIISNSLKFMEKESKLISLIFKENSGYLVVKIRDNGVGIDQNELIKIFDRFYRTDPSRNRNTGGSGLGLAIARQIIEQHNGIIQADSIKGQWTEISFKIPQA